MDSKGKGKYWLQDEIAICTTSHGAALGEMYSQGCSDTRIVIDATKPRDFKTVTTQGGISITLQRLS